MKSAQAIRLQRGEALQVESESLNVKISLEENGTAHISAYAMGDNRFSENTGMSGNAGLGGETISVSASAVKQ